MKKNIISLIFITIAIILCFSNEVYAMGNIIDGGDSFITLGKEKYDENKPLDEGALKITSKEIVNLLFTIGLVIAFGIGLIIGIQFITGSVDEKAKIKETMVPYVVGCIVLFSVFTIWKLVIGLGNEMETASIENPNEISISIIV